MNELKPLNEETFPKVRKYNKKQPKVKEVDIIFSCIEDFIDDLKDISNIDDDLDINKFNEERNEFIELLNKYKKNKEKHTKDCLDEYNAFINNLENFLTNENLYTREYIRSVEDLIINNISFKEYFKKDIYNLVLTKNTEISYILSFFSYKSSVNFIVNHIYDKFNENRNISREDIISIATFVLSYYVDIEFDWLINELKLTEEEHKKVSENIDYLYKKEKDNEYSRY